MRIVAFYSYKGGTGRTLSMANIARFAASIGKKVIAIDMDLEAPGLTYKLLGPHSPAPGTRGLVGCLLDTIHGSAVPLDLNEYLINVKVPNPEFVSGSESGWLKLMPAGNVPSPNYFGELRRLALDARTEDGSATQLLRALIERLQVDFEPDLIFIDARTGITNTNTLVLSELADAVFTFFLDLPEQIDGVRMVLRSLAPLTRDTVRPVGLFGVATRVPVADEQYQAGWVESSHDIERTARLEKFFVEPGPSASFTVDQISLFSLHHESGLLDGEQLMLSDLMYSNSKVTVPLAWDYARLAAAVIDDRAAVARAVAGLTRSSDSRDWARAAVISADSALRAGPGSREKAEPSHSQSGASDSKFDSIETLRELAKRDPAAKQQLAALLLELGTARAQIGDRFQAVPPTEEAVTIYRELAATNPAFRNNLAMSLNNLGIRYSEIGQRHEAVKPTEEAVTIYRELAASNPAFRNDLAGSLNNLGARYSEIGQRHEAVKPTEEAVTIYRELAASNPAFRNDLAGSLNNLGARYSEIGRSDESEAALSEARSTLGD